MTTDNGNPNSYDQCEPGIMLVLRCVALRCVVYMHCGENQA